MKLASLLDTMANKPTAEIVDGLRQLERKTSLVFTLLKASVYSIVLQQEIYSGTNDGGASKGLGSEEISMISRRILLLKGSGIRNVDFWEWGITRRSSGYPVFIWTRNGVQFRNATCYACSMQ